MMAKCMFVWSAGQVECLRELAYPEGKEEREEVISHNLPLHIARDKEDGEGRVTCYRDGVLKTRI